MWKGRTVCDKYRIDEVIGTGGFGVVYRGWDLVLNRNVAIKVPRADRCEPQDLARFLDEARNLASLSHPNVVQIRQLGEFEGQKFIEMEYLEGETLESVIRGGRLSVRERLMIMRKVASGLEAMHQIGILHRDLSPNNVKVCVDGTPKIFDLGMSRDTRVSRTGSMRVAKGTWGYFPPELLLGQPMTAPGDVFAFGSILYELLCGENAFHAEHDATMVYNLAHRTPTPVESRMTNCPPALAALVHACLRRDPQARPQSMAEVGRQLDLILAGQGLEEEVQAVERLRPRRTSSGQNPYLHRMMIRNRADFFGRGIEVQKIFSRLNASPPGSVSVVGDRKVGKSSLLNHVYTPQVRSELLEDPDSMVMAYLDMQVEKNMSVATFVEMLLALVGHELRGRLDVSDCERSLTGISNMMKRLSAAGIRLAVLLDEFEAITSNPNFGLEFFSFLRALASHYDVAYVTSSARDLQVLCHTQEIKDSPFFNIFTPIRLTAFPPAEAEELVRVPSSRVGRPLERHASQIFELSGLFPFYIQVACSHTLEHLDQRNGAEPDFAEIRRRFRDEADLHYRYLWDNFEPHEREVITKTASERGIPDSLGHVLEDLQRSGYISSGEQPRVFAGPFRDFVRSQSQKDRSGSLWDRIFGRSRGRPDREGGR